MIAMCIGCGCDDFHACWDDAAESPCSWLAVDRQAGLGVCSCCADVLPAWEQGDREMRVPVEIEERNNG